MATITLHEAQTRLAEIVGTLACGEELRITDGTQVVARLVGERAEQGQQRLQPGFASDMIAIVAEDDDHLADFAEYMR